MHKILRWVLFCVLGWVFFNPLYYYMGFCVEFQIFFTSFLGFFLLLCRHIGAANGVGVPFCIERGVAEMSHKIRFVWVADKI